MKRQIGVVTSGASNCTFSNSQFTFNQIRESNLFSIHSSNVKFENCNVSYNHGLSTMISAVNSVVHYHSSTISSNFFKNATLMLHSFDGEIGISNNIITNNTFVDFVLTECPMNITISNSSISKNKGVLFSSMQASTLNLSDNIISFNTANDSVLFNINQSNMYSSNTQFIENNRAKTIISLNSDSSTSTVDNCSFLYNSNISFMIKASDKSSIKITNTLFNESKKSISLNNAKAQIFSTSFIHDNHTSLKIRNHSDCRIYDSVFFNPIDNKVAISSNNSALEISDTSFDCQYDFLKIDQAFKLSNLSFRGPINFVPSSIKVACEQCHYHIRMGIRHYFLIGAAAIALARVVQLSIMFRMRSKPKDEEKEINTQKNKKGKKSKKQD